MKSLVTLLLLLTITVTLRSIIPLALDTWLYLHLVLSHFHRSNCDQWNPSSVY